MISRAYHFRVPPNMVIEIDDAEDEWLYKPNSLDFVHARYMFFGIRDWPKLLKRAMKWVAISNDFVANRFRTLKPGGWIELIEIHVVPQSYDNSIPEPCQIREFYNVLKPLGAKMGIDLDVAPKFKGFLENAGRNTRGFGESQHNDCGVGLLRKPSPVASAGEPPRLIPAESE